jgi:hypothetical protein
MIDWRVWARPLWSVAEKAGTRWPTSGPVLMVCPSRAASARAHSQGLSRLAILLLAATFWPPELEIEHFCFRNHSHRRPIRGDSYGVGQCFPAAGRLGALLKRLHWRKVNPQRFDRTAACLEETAIPWLLRSSSCRPAWQRPSGRALSGIPLQRPRHLSAADTQRSISRWSRLLPLFVTLAGRVTVSAQLFCDSGGHPWNRRVSLGTTHSGRRH